MSHYLTDLLANTSQMPSLQPRPPALFEPLSDRIGLEPEISFTNQPDPGQNMVSNTTQTPTQALSATIRPVSQTSQQAPRLRQHAPVGSPAWQDQGVDRTGESVTPEAPRPDPAPGALPMLQPVNRAPAEKLLRAADNNATILPTNPLTTTVFTQTVIQASQSRQESSEARQAGANPEPAIHIHIGRIEVRAITPAAPARERAASTTPRAQPVGLDEYLKQRSEGKR